jgi:ethanolaminephosphotransferase
MTVVSSLAFKMNMAYHSGEAVPKIVEKFLIPMDQQHPEKLISLARMCFLSVGVSMLYQLLSLKRPLTSLSYLLEVFLVTQTRTRNIPIFILFNLMRTYVRRNVRDVTTTGIFILILQHVSFFALGNSNSMASIDLANAYNGVSSYNIAIVGILTFLSNWVGPIYWSFSGLAIIMESETLKNKMKGSNKELSDENLSRKNILTTKIIVTQLFFSVASTGIMGACLALKHHLFIWTVFSPKLLYAASWVILQHGLIDTILSTILSPL